MVELWKYENFEVVECESEIEDVIEFGYDYDYVVEVGIDVVGVVIVGEFVDMEENNL